MTTAHPARVRDWARQVRVLREGLDSLLATSDRSDPVDETVLSMFESALHAATAAGRLRWEPGSAEARAATLDMLAAARAAVVTASFAMAELPPAPTKPRTEPRPGLRAVPGGGAAANGRQLERDRHDTGDRRPTVDHHD